VPESEAELVRELYDEFVSIYGEDRVQPERPVGPDLRPDFTVFNEEGNVLLIAEAKLSSSTEGAKKSFDQLRRYLKNSGAEFGCHLTENMRYFFRPVTVDDLQFQISIADFPTVEAEIGERRGFNDYAEFMFCVEQVQRILSGQKNLKLELNDLLQELQRLAVAEDEDIQFTASDNDLLEQLKSVDEVLKDQYSFYSAGYDETDLARSRIIQGVFNGYSVRKTDDKVLEKIVSQLPSRFSDQSQYGTPVASAQYLVDLLDISSSDRVLDPAMGWGNVLREVSKSDSRVDCHGIEINLGIARTASALDTITDVEVGIEVTDGIAAAFEREEYRSNFDHVVLDPPIGKRLDEDELPAELEEWNGSNIEDVFLYASLDYLDEGGKITAIIPQGLLSRGNSKNLRRELVEDYQIEKIIEVSDGSFYPSIAADLAVIQVSKPDTVETNLTELIVLESLKRREDGNVESDVEQRVAVSLPTEFSDQTLIPIKLIAAQEIDEQIKNIYSRVDSLESVSSVIRKGVHVSSEHLSVEGGIQYLKISDVTDESDSPVYLSEDAVNEYVVAGPSDLLISAAGSTDVAYVPDEEVIPHSNWAVVRFQSKVLAKTYKAFFSTELGTGLLDSLATGSKIPHLPVSNLQEATVPVFTDENAPIDELNDIDQLKEGRVDSETANRIEDILSEGE
jgi:hypothetical protein